MLCNNNSVTLAIEFLHFYVPVELFLKSPSSLPQKPGVWNFILVLSQENKDPGERLPYENHAVLIVSIWEWIHLASVVLHHWADPKSLLQAALETAKRGDNGV